MGGRGMSSKSGGAGSAYKEAEKMYAYYLKKYEDNYRGNPNAVTYRDGVENYRALRDTAKGMKKGDSYDGLEGVVAMDMLKNDGATVDISGTIFPGTYKYQEVNAWGMKGMAWVQQGVKSPHSFVGGTSTIASELGQIKGGKMVANKKVKIKIKK